MDRGRGGSEAGCSRRRGAPSGPAHEGRSVLAAEHGLACLERACVRGATHVIVLGDEIVFCDVGAEQSVAHQVDEAQTEAFESRHSAGRQEEGSRAAGPGMGALLPMAPTAARKGVLPVWAAPRKGTAS